MILETEAIFETEIDKIGHDFAELEGFMKFKDGSVIPVKYNYEIFEVNKVRFKVLVTGIDVYKVDGIFFKDKNGVPRVFDNDNPK